MVSVNSLRTGGKFLLDSQPHIVLDNEHVKPGKGQAFNRIKARNLMTGRVITKTYPSNSDVELADVLETDMQMLYKDADGYHFMDDSTYEQYMLSEEELAGAQRWLVESSVATVVVWQGKAISVEAPTFVELEVTDCAPNAKGDTVSGGTKSAVLETGFEIKVPLFIEQGNRIKVDTRTAEYVSRV
ncbi:elongation factor P [Gammaproteobacteria bacterium]|nr:elongation factor P [Gammaproteobacteria bacterium]